ncbi:uncharacterized protein LOC143222153 [Tachypleus tridentatus]|uniref:uncharacterized protein LOC143222153 n=1 Tax=Tachypleus tridentatus TaxID=6853 RepID=UPI003FCF19BF
MITGVKMLLCLGLIVATLAFETTDYEFEKSLKGIIARRKSLSYIKNMLRDLDARLEKLQKRTCFLNAGMSHSCDYKDLVSAVDEQKFWSSEHSPGKRRGSISSDVPKPGSPSRLMRLLRSFLPKHHQKK